MTNLPFELRIFKKCTNPTDMTCFRTKRQKVGVYFTFKVV